MAKPTQYADLMHAELGRRFDDAGYGTASRVERALDLYRGYFNQHKKAHTLDTGVLLAALKNLGVDPLDFLRCALDSDRALQATVASNQGRGRIDSPEGRLLMKRHGLDPDQPAGEG